MNKYLLNAPCIRRSPHIKRLVYFDAGAIGRIACEFLSNVFRCLKIRDRIASERALIGKIIAVGFNSQVSHYSVFVFEFYLLVNFNGY